MLKLNNLIETIKSAPKEFPVETAMGLTFSVAGMLLTESVIVRFTPLMFAFIIFVVAITLRKVNKSAYYGSYLLIWLVQLIIHDNKIVEQAWFWVLNCVAAIVLMANISKSDNKDFANAVNSRMGVIFKTVLLTAALSAMASAIIGTIMYLFTAEIWHLLIHINIIIMCMVMPLTFCYLHENSDEDDNPEGNFLRVLVDFIISPALLIYTVVLMVYIIKIVVVQELPRGGVAYMVSIYIALVLIANLLNKLLKTSHFDWFYNNFTYIAIAPIVLLWVGAARRISEYGLTEWRVYLLIINVLVTIFPLMLKIRRTNHYNLLTMILMAAMVLFTCIPPVSAKNIGIKSQYSRFLDNAKDIGAFNPSTWTFDSNIDTVAIKNDSTLRQKYWQMKDEYQFLCKHTDTIRKKYSTWSHWHSIAENKQYDDMPRSYWFKLDEHVDNVPLDGFDNYILTHNYDADYNNGVLVVSRDGETILKYHIQDSLQSAGQQFYNDPLKVLKYHNDSVLIFIDDVWMYDKGSVFEIENISKYEVKVFKK